MGAFESPSNSRSSRWSPSSPDANGNLPSEQGAALDPPTTAFGSFGSLDADGELLEGTSEKKVKNAAFRTSTSRRRAVKCGFIKAAVAAVVTALLVGTLLGRRRAARQVPVGRPIQALRGPRPAGSADEGRSDEPEAAAAPDVLEEGLSDEAEAAAAPDVLGETGPVEAVEDVVPSEQLLPFEQGTPVEEATVQAYATDLETAAAELEAAWHRAPQTVREAFMENYMMRQEDDDESPSTPLAYFQPHIQPLLSKRSLPAARPTEEWNHALVTEMSLVSTLLKAAASRLHFLIALDKLCDSCGLGAELLNREEVPLPPAGSLKEDTDLVDFAQFAWMVQCMPVVVSEKVYAASEDKIPKVLAQRLADTVKASQLQLENDRHVHGLLHRFVQSVGPSAPPIVDVGGTPFLLELMQRRLELHTRLRERDILTPKVVGSWGTEWSIDEVLERLALNEEEAHLRLEDWRELKPVIPFESLFALATGLL